MSQCVFCLNNTSETCVECGDPFCITEHASALCPMCIRIKVFKAEQAARRTVVYWQYVEPVADAPLLIGKPVEPGALTQTMETVKVEAR